MNKIIILLSMYVFGVQEELEEVALGWTLMIEEPHLRFSIIFFGESVRGPHENRLSAEQWYEKKKKKIEEVGKSTLVSPNRPFYTMPCHSTPAQHNQPASQPAVNGFLRPSSSSRRKKDHQPLKALIKIGKIMDKAPSFFIVYLHSIQRVPSKKPYKCDLFHT